MHPQVSSSTVRRRSWQRGGAVLAVMAGLLVVAASTLAIRMARQVEDKTAQQQLTLQRMQRIGQALQAYALVHGCPLKLPDGAMGNRNEGDLKEGVGEPTGTTVPWRTLGIAREDAFDAWGRKISYLGSIGAVKVNVFETIENADWALVSHGPTGLGAWLPSGQRMLPLPVNPDELTNANLTGTLQLKPENTGQQVAPANFFDDFLLWGSLAVGDCAASSGYGDDLIKKLLQNPTAIVTGGSGSDKFFVDFDAGDLGTVRISTTGAEISTDGPYKTLGACSSGCGTGNSSNRALDSSESLSIRLGTGKTAQGFALGLLGISSANTSVAVSVTFKRNGAVVGSFTKSATINDTMPTSPQLPNLSPPPPALPGTLFDEVVVQPKDFPPSVISRFFVANVFFCQTSTCP